MKKLLWAVLALLLLAGCGAAPEKSGYQRISMEEAREMMDSGEDFLLVDVRTPEEYAGGHIPGAVNVPNESIAEAPHPALPDREQTILIYCRSGNRSRQAAGKLARAGYTNILEIGGIRSWDGPLETQ